MNRPRVSGIIIVLTLTLWLSGSAAAQMRPVDVECGSTIQGKIGQGEEHVYRLPLYEGDALELEFVLNGWNGSRWYLKRSNNTEYRYGYSGDKYVPSGKIPIEKQDNYLIVFTLGDLTKGGAYTLYITCTFADGTVKKAGNTTASTETVSGNTGVPFSGFGFPGIAAVDFKDGIEIALQAEQAQTVPVGNDVTLLTYEADAESTATLKVTRVNGDIAMGITVIKRDTNEIIFVGGLPSSDHLSVELHFPSKGTYVVGVFRLVTADQTKTSGAVQVSLG